MAELTLIHERETANFDIQVIGAVRTMADGIAPYATYLTRLTSVGQSLYTLNVLDVRGKGTFGIDAEGSTSGSDVTLRVNKIQGDSTGGFVTC